VTPRAKLTLAAVSVAFAAADTYVVVLALPDMMTGVGLSADELQRAAPIISGFLLGYIAVLPLIGRVADVAGRTPVLVAALLLFAVGSLITAAAYDLPLIVSGRFLQGVGGGGLVPATLALVADLWPAERRGLPLGVVGAVQEIGSVLGPLFGAAVLSVADWRAIFWINLTVAVVLAVLLRGRRRARNWPATVAGVLACVLLALTLLAPDRLATDVTLGLPFVPFTGESRLATPIGMATLVLAALWAVLTTWRLRTGARDVLHRIDLPGALLLAVALAGVVLAFATAEPERELMAPAGPWLLAGSVVFAIGFALWQRRTPQAIVPPGLLAARPAWGALVISFLVGAALIAALVDVPVFARTTTEGGDQLGAALVLLRFLIALPVGAVVGGWLTRRTGLGPITAAGLTLSGVMFILMTGWDQDALRGAPATIVLLLCGFGFGLAISPVNSAILAATRSDSAGLASALVVVARMVGMLVGVSALTAIGLRRYYSLADDVRPPAELCPDSPGLCRPYLDALREAAISQSHAIFAGASVCAFAAAVVAILLLGHSVRPPGEAGDRDTPAARVP
jgi:MFS family permease